MRQLELSHAVAALVLIALAAVACQTNPVTGKREVIMMSTEREQQIDKQAAQQVAAQMGLLENPQLTPYVKAIATRLSVMSPRKDVKYEINIVDTPEPNAFALPGGSVYVSRGLLILTNSEDELANVIGHEIGHVAARHAAQRDARATGVGILSTVGMIAAAVAGGGEAAQALGMAAQMAGQGVIASYGRDQERQADELGQQFASRAGWDPMGMANFLKTLERETTNAAGGKARKGNFLDSHPLTPERVQNTGTRARGMTRGPGKPITAGREGFLRRLDGLLIGTSPAEGKFVESSFLHPDMDFSLRFPQDWPRQNTKDSVAAGAPDGTAVFKLELDGGKDPKAAAEAFVQNARMQVGSDGPFRASGQKAYRVTGNLEGADADISWIARSEGVFRITCLSRPGFGDRFRPLCERTVRSFRSLNPEERDGFQEVRLELVTAKQGETLFELGKRVDNHWTPEETAIANGFSLGERLEEGQLVKIARAKRYVGRADAPAT
jgi:predicted Zn-dependent protease